MRNAAIICLFIVCISLFFLIKNKYGSSEILFTLTSSRSVRSFVEQPNETYKVQKPGIKDTKQFMMHGKWKPGRGHNQTCNFLPKTYPICSKKVLNFHFEFHEDRLNKINAVEELRKILKFKKLLLIGDSLMTEFYFGLAELLQVKAKQRTYRCGMNFTLHPGINGTLMHIRACLILLKGHETFAKWDKTRLIPEENIRRAIAEHDVIVFNQGIHYDEFTLMCQSAIYFNNLGKMLYDATRNTSKRVILRATLPQHFITKAGMGFYGRIFTKDNNSCATKVPFPVPHPTNYFLKNMARRFNFSFLDNFSIYYERGDFARGKIGAKMDCSHHWHSPELIWPELVLLTQIIKE